MTAPPDDPLERFLVAQARDHDRALSELRAGRKLGHWMWYVLPQLRGLGKSEKSRYYGLRDRREAGAYLAHPVLGPRLREAVAAMLLHRHRSAVAILGCTDALKFQACMTLFARAAPGEPLFRDALNAFHQGCEHRATRQLLGLADGDPAP